MAKYRIYAVGYGVDPDTKEPVFGLKFTNWPDCQRYIKGVNGARYKGFLTDDEADIWMQQIKDEVTGKSVPENSNPAGYSNLDTSDWQDKAKKIYDTHIHPVDEEFISTCKNLGLSVHDTEHMIKKMFIDTIQYLYDNDCINELPFEE